MEYNKRAIFNILGIRSKKDMLQFPWFRKPTVRVGIIAQMKPENKLAFIKDCLTIVLTEGDIDNLASLFNNTSEELFSKIFAATFFENIDTTITIADEQELTEVFKKIANSIANKIWNGDKNEKNG
jgi:hypothetical protein